jgi:hypothetical protein
MIREKQDGEDLVLIAVDRSDAAAGEQEALRLDGNTGNVVAKLKAGSVAAAALAAGLSAGGLVAGVASSSGSGHITTTGAKVGAKVLALVYNDMAGLESDASHYESTVSVQDQIQITGMAATAHVFWLVLNP